MRRIFDASPETDLLINRETAEKGCKIGFLINDSVYRMLTPRAIPLAKASEFIISKELDGSITERDTKEAISQGLVWLRSHNLRNCEPLSELFAQFYTPISESPDNAAPEHAIEMFRSVESRIKSKEPSFNGNWYHYATFAESILLHWEHLWDFQPTYLALSAIVLICSPRMDFDWYTAITFLRKIESAYEKSVI